MMLQNPYLNVPTNDIDQITETVYLGNYKGANDLLKILELGITKVVSVIGERPAPTLPNNIKQKIIPILDSPSVNVIQYFKQCLSFMDGEEKVLVHCYLGASRSATFVIAYIMYKKRMSFLNAYNYVKTKRQIVCPNYGFMQQLLIFDKILKQNNYNISDLDFSTIKYPSPSSACGGCCHEWHLLIIIFNQTNIHSYKYFFKNKYFFN